MPIYEYACHECNHTLDALQKIADAPLVDCPACGKPGLKRLLS
ncbi:MAG: zinc ribbon domain-containing protein, partial [Gammaproteobacteria bacterium]|nr:zinc ribbon domain-containing protein [Gammaproteobacteria bacterium]